MIDLCFIIPTYNRFDRLIRTLNQIKEVFNNTNINYEIFIVDNSSDSKTFEYFSLKNQENTTYYKREKSIPNGNHSVHQSILDVDVKAQWYWWLGDDDYILSESIPVIKYCLSNTEINYLHATDATFILSNSNIIDTGKNIITHFGILELTSFMSSQLFSKKILLQLKNKILNQYKEFNWSFNFNHSLIISEIIWTEKCMVSEKGMVLAQNHVLKEDDQLTTPRKYYESLRGWFNLSDFIDIFTRSLNIKRPINEKLFFYRNKPIWDSYLVWILSFLIIDTEEVVIEDLNKILELIEKSDVKSDFLNNLILTIIQIEKLRSSVSVEYSKEVIIPFYTNVLNQLKSLKY
jgi:hypothetical protein